MLKTAAASGMGIALIDGDGVPVDLPLTAGPIQLDSPNVGLLVRRCDDMVSAVVEFDDPGERLCVADRPGWLLASVGTLGVDRAAGSAQSFFDPHLAQTPRLMKDDVSTRSIEGVDGGLHSSDRASVRVLFDISSYFP